MLFYLNTVFHYFRILRPGLFTVRTAWNKICLIKHDQIMFYDRCERDISLLS